MDPQHPQEIDLLSYEKVYDDDRVGPATPRPNPKKSRSPPKSPQPKTTKATGKNKPKKRKTKRKVKKSKRKVKKPKRKTKRKARGLVNEHFMNSLTDNRYIPDNRSGIELIEHQSYGMNPDGSRITPRVEGKIKTTRTLVSSSKPKSTIKKTRKHT